jgi:uncharacterized membrane protein
VKRGAALVLCGWLLLPSTAWTHGTETHDDKATQATKPAPTEARPAPTPAQAQQPVAAKGARPSDGEAPNAEPPERSAAQGAAEKAPEAKARLSLESLVRDLRLDDFPTLHPMAVHVPVTFIPLALLFALMALFSARRIFAGLALGFTLGGLAGGVVAAFPLHPHTSGLSAAARQTLDKHDVFAYGTLWLALLAAAIGLVCLWRPGRLCTLALCLALLLATLSVAVTAHYGGTLAYVHGVGVQGRYLIGH